MTHAETLETLAWTVDALYGAVLVGNPAPAVKALYSWMKAPPSPGDLLYEITTAHLRGLAGRIGRFERIEIKSVCVHEARDANMDRCSDCPAASDERWLERYTWIITGAEDVDDPWRHRWSNARFIRIPQNRLDAIAIRELGGDL